MSGTGKKPKARAERRKLKSQKERLEKRVRCRPLSHFPYMFVLRRADGTRLRGGYPPSTLLEKLPHPHLLSSLQWSSVAGPQNYVPLEQVELEMSRSFDWLDFIGRCARALATLRAGVQETSPSKLLNQTAQALLDDWPVAVEDPFTICRWLSEKAPLTTTTTNAGFLAMMSIALRRPWSPPEHVLPEPEASRRLMRLGMICSDLAEPGPRSGPFTTARILLDIHRTQSFDRAIPRLVRAHRMYVEILGAHYPQAAVAFEARTGMSLGDWIFGLCLLRDLLEYRAGVDFRGELPTLGGAAVLATRALAAPPSWYEEQLKGRTLDSVSIFRERPIIELGDEQYLVIQQDFLLNAADEGVVARLRESLGPLPNQLGEAFQAYVGEVLRRCFGEENVADVLQTKNRNASGGKRCDFAIVVNGDLLLIDAKQLLLGDKVLDGIDDIDCLFPQLRKGLWQIVDTSNAVLAGEISSVAPSLPVPRGWRPRRCFGWLVVQPELPIWFNSRRNLIRREFDLSRAWNGTVAGWPLVVPIASLEHLEAAGLHHVRRLLDLIEKNHPYAGIGVPGFLSVSGYDGSVYSDHITAQFREICSRYGI